MTLGRFLIPLLSLAGPCHATAPCAETILELREGASIVCTRGPYLEARFPADKLTVGPAAHWAMRYTLSGGADFTFTRVAAGRMKIAIGRWSGQFAARGND